MSRVLCSISAGDLLAALLLAWLHRTPDDLQLAVERAVSSLQAVIIRTAAAAGIAAGTRERTIELCKARELRLIESRDCFEDPAITVSAMPLWPGFRCGDYYRLTTLHCTSNDFWDASWIQWTVQFKCVALHFIHWLIVQQWSCVITVVMCCLTIDLIILPCVAKNSMLDICSYFPLLRAGSTQIPERIWLPTHIVPPTFTM